MINNGKWGWSTMAMISNDTLEEMVNSDRQVRRIDNGKQVGIVNEIVNNGKWA